MGENNQEWSWVGEDGLEHAVDESELTFSLSSEELPAHILVTKHGWGEWLPAMQVAELQWALPAGSADNPRKPSAGRKPKPPLERYPALKQRARDIASGLIDPTAESSLAMPAVQVAPRPPASAPMQPVPAQYRGFSMADAEEPTLQIDAEALDFAFERMQGTAAAGASGSVHPPPAVARTQLQGSDMGLPSLPPEALSSIEPPPLPDAARAEMGEGQSSSTVSGPENLRPAPPTGVSSWPPRASAPSAPGFSPSAFPPTRPSAIPAALPSYRPPAPVPPAARNKWPWVIVSLGVASAVISLSLLGKRPEPAAQPAPVVTPPPSTKPEPVLAQCKVAVSALPIAGWIYPNVRPVTARAPGTDGVAVGYAQNSRVAVGLIVDTRTLNVQKPFTTQGNSPLLSVVPATTAMGQQLSFLESRAASTLQSTIFVPAKRPFAFGLNREGLSVRREGELQDTVVWKPQWETITVPSSARLDDKTFAIAVRAGGERGSLMLGRLSEEAEPIGELQELIVDAQRVGTPTLTVASGKSLVAFDATARDGSRKLYVASGNLPKLPSMPEALVTSHDQLSYPGAVALSDGSLVLTYTRGVVGSQSVVAQVFDAKRKPVGPVIEVSAGDKDAYNSELILDGDRVVVLYIVRQGNNNELWATSLSCLPGEPAP